MSLWFLGSDDDQNDEELMARYQAGDSRALGILYDRYARRLRSFAAGRGAKRPDDVVQDAFMRVVRKGDSFAGSSRFKTWLFAIARNLCIDASRRDRFREMPKLEDPVGGEGGMTRGDTIANPAPRMDAERAAASRQFKVALEAALAALPDEQREVFVLRQHSGMPFAEIATVLGCKENTAKSRMRYALKALRAALREYI